MKTDLAIVTGSSSGFGLLTSLALAKKGYRVLATMRNIEKGTHLLAEAEKMDLNERIEIHELDVTDETSVQKFNNLIQNIGQVDILVNNAGYANAGFVEEIPIIEYKQQFETNVFGLIAVTQAVIPLMRKQCKGKIINVSSISGRIGFPGLSPYVASKHALEGFSECLRLELKPFGIDVHLIEPGSFQTNIWSSGKHVTEKSLQVTSPYYESMKKMDAHLQANESQFGDPEDVAMLIANIAQQDNSPFRHPIGKGVKLSIIGKNLLPWKWWEKLVLNKIKSGS